MRRKKKPNSLRVAALILLSMFLFTNILIGLVAANVMAKGTEKTPVITDKQFFDRVASSVVMLTNPEGDNGGTGFQVAAPSGKRYIMTNEHICSIASPGTTLKARTEAGKIHTVAIVKISPQADLCLMDGIEGLPALEMGNEAYAGMYAMVVGHPRLQPTTIEAGILMGLEPVTTAEIMQPGDKCNRYGEEPYTQNGIFGATNYCLRTLMSQQSNIHIYPGNSGSPVVNLKGQVIGVAYAANTDDFWGALVPLMEVHNFLVGY
jgi:S1-C subfamily serine protease